MTTLINNKTFQVKETNGKYFYWSLKADRWLPIKKANVTL